MYRGYAKIASGFVIWSWSTWLVFAVGETEDIYKWRFVWSPYKAALSTVVLIIDMIEILHFFSTFSRNLKLGGKMTKAVDSWCCCVAKDKYSLFRCWCIFCMCASYSSYLMNGVIDEAE